MATWKKEYNGSVVPTDDGFSLASGHDSTKATVKTFDQEKWLEFLGAAGGSNCQFFANNSTTHVWDPTNATGWTLYLRVQVTTAGFRGTIDDGTYRETLNITPSAITLKSTSFTANFQRPRDVRITGAGTSWKVYLDESDTADITITAAVAASADLLQFGITSADANAQCFLRRLAWSESDDLLASQFAAPSVVTTYCSVQDVRDYLGVDSSAISDSTIARIVRNSEYAVDEAFFGGDYSRTSLVFASSVTETNEQIDYNGSDILRVRYPYVQSISAVSYRSSSDLNSWTTLSVNDLTGYIASDRDRERGAIRIPTSWRNARRAGSFRLTYVHGPSSVPRAVQELTVMKAALHVYNATLQHGAADVFQARRTALESLIKDRERKIGESRVSWKVV